MRTSAIFTTVIVALLGSVATAAPVEDSSHLSSRQESDPALVIFKTYADASKCRGGQGSDDYTSIAFGYRSQAVSGECIKFDRAGGWDGLKAVNRYATDFNVTAYAYTTANCVDDGDKAALFDSVCHNAESNYLSFNFVKW